MICIFSPQAESDLFEIALRIAEENAGRAVSFADDLRERCEKLAAYPGIGRKRTELHPELRSLAHGNYVIFYTEIASGVRIERILHGARDIPSLLKHD